MCLTPTHWHQSLLLAFALSLIMRSPEQNSCHNLVFKSLSIRFRWFFIITAEQWKLLNFLRVCRTFSCVCVVCLKQTQNIYKQLIHLTYLELSKWQVPSQSIEEQSMQTHVSLATFNTFSYSLQAHIIHFFGGMRWYQTHMLTRSDFYFLISSKIRV